MNQAETTIKGVNDKEEYEMTDEAFDILNFSAEEKLNCYKAREQTSVCETKHAFSDLLRPRAHGRYEVQGEEGAGGAGRDRGSEEGALEDVYKENFN